MADCEVDGCDRAAFCKGLCSAHYHRQWRYGRADEPHRRAPSGSHLAWLQSMVGFEGDGCVTWPFKAKTPKGYGVTGFQGQMQNASRVMCVLAHGEPPTSSHEAANSCGKGHEGCVNPGHLRWATRSENHMDKRRHGTALLGEANHQARLSGEQVAAIRAASGRVVDIAQSHGVSVSHAYDIRAGKRWPHLAQLG